MQTMFVRLIEPNSATHNNGPFVHDIWRRFILEKVISRIDDFTLVELRLETGGDVLIALWKLVDLYPPIITIDREHGEYQIFETFSVDFERPSIPGFVGVKDSAGNHIEFPTAIVLKAERHLCDPVHTVAI